MPWVDLPSLAVIPHTSLTGGLTDLRPFHRLVYAEEMRICFNLLMPNLVQEFHECVAYLSVEGEA